MRGEERAVVHLVNMIARQDQHLRGAVRTNDVEVLVDGVGCASVPLATDALRRRQHLDEFLAAQLKPGPAVHEVTNQRVRLVLRQHADAANARIEAVRQREVDDAVLATEEYRRLCSPVRQFVQA